MTEQPNIGPPNAGQPNEKALNVLREIAERQKGRRSTESDSVALVRYGRSGPMYGMPFVDDSWMDPDNEQPGEGK